MKQNGFIDFSSTDQHPLFETSLSYPSFLVKVVFSMWSSKLVNEASAATKCVKSGTNDTKCYQHGAVM